MELLQTKMYIFSSPGNFAQPFKNPLVIRGMNEANLLAHIVAAAPKR